MKLARLLKEIPPGIYLRYALLNLPSVLVLVGILFIIRLYLPLPDWALAVVLAAWILKDLVLFPFIWRSYDQSRPGLSRAMTGSTGVVKEPLSPNGLVQINGELWKAINMGHHKVIDKGVQVRVVKRIGLTVQVVPLEADVEPAKGKQK